VKRTAEANVEFNICSVVRFTDYKRLYRLPHSAKALGYFHSVRFADGEKYFAARPV